MRFVFLLSRTVLKLSLTFLQHMMKSAGRCVETYDVLPEEYVVSETNRHPPILQYALPAPIANVYGYDKWCIESGNMRPDETITQVLSDLCRHRIRLGRPFYQTKDAGYIFEIYNNYRTKKKEKLSDEKEEEILTMLRGELNLAEDVKPRWYFHFEDPRAPVAPEFEDEYVVFNLVISLI